MFQVPYCQYNDNGKDERNTDIAFTILNCWVNTGEDVFLCTFKKITQLTKHIMKIGILKIVFQLNCPIAQVE